MNREDKIYFVTTNASKFSDLNRRFANTEYILHQIITDVEEGRFWEVEKTALHKLNQARKLSKNQPVFVEDRGFYLPVLNNFPGSFVKFALKTIGTQGLLDLMLGNKDRTAKFISVLGFWDGKQEHYFIEEEVGFLHDRVSGNNDRGWSELMYIYGYPMFPDRSLAELNDEEWQRYLREIEKSDYIDKFIKYLIENRF